MKLFSRILGANGKPLVVMHGLFGMSDNWQTHGKSWADAGFQVHLLDMRNHGQSPHSPEHTYQAMADDVLEYFDDQKIENAIVIGHSMGGKVAMLFASQHPARTDKLVVVDIAPKGYPVHHDEIIAGLRALDFGVLKSRGEADKVLGQHLSIPAIRQFLLKSLYWKTKEELAFRFNLDAVEANIDMVGAPLATLAFYDQPTLFVRGALSNYIKDGDEQLIHRHFPQAKLVTIPNAGHWVHAEQAAAFYKAIGTFLG